MSVMLLKVVNIINQARLGSRGTFQEYLALLGFRGMAGATKERLVQSGM